MEAWKLGGHGSEATLHYGAPTALFTSYIRLAALSGLLFALPVILWQVWAFIAPGLYSREKKFAIPFVVSSIVLFLAGGYFGWAIAFPWPSRAILRRSASRMRAYVSGAATSSHSSSVGPKLKLMYSSVLMIRLMRPSGARTRAATTAR